jgi:hypothetical protein
MATAPEQHASTTDPSTWSDYNTALAAVQAKAADGLTYILTKDDPHAAIDIDNCRDLRTGSIDVWAQNFLDTGRHSYSEITPSGTGCRIWGLAKGSSVHRKFSLVIDGKDIAAELFRATNKALTITGYRLDTIRAFTNIDRVIDWGIAWGERRKAAALEAATSSNGNSFDSSGCKYSIEQIELIVRNGAPDGTNRSEVFHSIIGHYLGCGWAAEQIHEHLAQNPSGIAARYLAEERLGNEIARSISKYGARELPLLNGDWVNGREAKAPDPEPQSELQPEPQQPIADPELEDDELNENDELDEELQSCPQQSPYRIYTYNDPDPDIGQTWLIKHLIPACGHGLLSGQWGAAKTFIVFDLFAAIITQQPFLNYPVKRQCGAMLIAAEGAREVKKRLDAIVREKCGGMIPPIVWTRTAPELLRKGSLKILIDMAQEADQRLQEEFGLPLGLIVIDTITACAGYTRAGDDNDTAVGSAVMNILKALAEAMNCFVFGVAHFGKTAEAGTKGTSSKEDLADVILVALGDKALDGSVANTRLAVRKNRGDRQGQNYPFVLRRVELGQDEDNEAITTMIIDWTAGSAEPAVANDPWQQARQTETRQGMVLLKRVLMSVLAKEGVDLPSEPDGPVVRMVDQEIVREEFYARTAADGTPAQKQEYKRKRFNRALNRAEEMQLVGLREMNDTAYLWLLRPDLDGE